MLLTRSFPFRASLALALTLVLGGCGAGAMAGEAMAPPVAPSPASGVSPGAPSMGDAPAAPSPAQAPNGATIPAKEQGRSASAAPAAKPTSAKSADVESAPLIVYVGDLGMTADAETIAPTLDRVVDIAESLGGHLAGRGDTTVKVKIPSKHFREGMSAVEKLASVTKRSVTADDVTAEFKDLEVRLENLRATRKRLEEFLARATNIADTLTVEQQLERVAMEIDQIQGRMRYLKDATSFSLLSVEIVAKPKPAPVVVAVEKTPPLPPAPHAVSIPIDWLADLGVATLLDLKKSP
jgi:hypothetical protein